MLKPILYLFLVTLISCDYVGLKNPIPVTSEPLTTIPDFWDGVFLKEDEALMHLSKKSNSIGEVHMSEFLKTSDINTPEYEKIIKLIDDKTLSYMEGDITYQSSYEIINDYISFNKIIFATLDLTAGEIKLYDTDGIEISSDSQPSETVKKSSLKEMNNIYFLNIGLDSLYWHVMIIEPKNGHTIILKEMDKHAFKQMKADHYLFDSIDEIEGTPVIEISDKNIPALLELSALFEVSHLEKIN